MNDTLINTLLIALAYLVLFASAEWMYHRWQWKAEVTRKYVHIVTGVLTLLFPIMIHDFMAVILLCSAFAIILVLSERWNLLPSINAVERKTRGSILYPVSVTTCYYCFSIRGELIYFYAPILILAFCDPVAALLGKKWPKGAYRTFGKQKTLSGSVGFLLLASLLCYLLLTSMLEMSWQPAIGLSLVVGLVTAFAEAITHRGYDNLTIPLANLAVFLVYF